MAHRYKPDSTLYLSRHVAVSAPSPCRNVTTASGRACLAAFTVGYAVMQLPGGILADRFGAKVMLVCAPLLWSVFTGLTGLVESTAALIVVRLCFGLAEGS
jgi:MFS transporter, ACS family, D-galactonate transporter